MHAESIGEFEFIKNVWYLSGGIYTRNPDVVDIITCLNINEDVAIRVVLILYRI